MLAIHPQYLTLSKLLAGRLFQIPEYQRAYSWTSQERRDLFSDLEKIHSKSSEDGHFMAAVVCLRRKMQTLGTDEFHILEVVDGQQRITTLIILLNCIKLALDPKKATESRLVREISELLIKQGDELLLLQTNHDSSHHFATFMRTGNSPAASTAKTIADRELLKAVEDCRAFTENWKLKNGDLIALSAILKNRLFFLLHEIEDEKSVYTVFEVLNSRGLDVSWLDRLKSVLMATAFEMPNANSGSLISDLHITWRDIYNVIGLRQELSNEALRFAATLKSPQSPSRPLGEKDSVEILREAGSSAKKLREVAAWLLRVTTACDTVGSNVRINAVTDVAQARLLAVAIHLRDDFSADQRESLLARWEKVTFRIYGMLCNDKRTKVGDYVRLAWSVVNDRPTAKSIDSSIVAIGKAFPIEEAIEELREANCYEGWEVELRYFMARYEESLAKGKNLNFRNEQWAKIWAESAADSIEHIWAKSKATEKSRHRLGNLVLLPPNLNSKLKDNSPRDKAAAYRATGLLIATAVADAIDAENWSAQAIAIREEALLKWAAREWAD